MTQSLIVRERASGLHVRAALLDAKAPAIVDLVTRWLTRPRSTPAVHAMWTGPELSAQIQLDELEPGMSEKLLPVQNTTIFPQPGEIVFLRIPEHTLEGVSDPVFDLGLFYGERGRLFFPFGWMPGSVFARVVPEDREHLEEACRRIRSAGRTRLEWSLVS